MKYINEKFHISYQNIFKKSRFDSQKKKHKIKKCFPEKIKRI